MMSVCPGSFKDPEKAFTFVVPKSPLGSCKCSPGVKTPVEVTVHVLRGGL